ncbi:hypothetical protein C8J55DRAFT_502924 [Lentinula edodes]|uniref:Uncharacterized protein n=1 Tax=Lentinula lateritia TaxID=40482 RepID=A0A9W9AWI8_9AGAR|nr:hypothetical protein C8J55DRAFT_502924 [Lentinula edodes]
MLIGIPSHYTNRTFPKFYWSGILRKIAYAWQNIIMTLIILRIVLSLFLPSKI